MGVLNIEDISIILRYLSNRNSPDGSPQLSPIVIKIQCHSGCRTCAVKYSNCST